MQGMYACRSAPKLRSREASARKQVKPEAPTPDAFGIARAKPKYGTPSGVSAGSCCPHHVAARRISKQLEEAQAHLPLPGLPQRFCEAKDLWEEGEKALSWQSHSVALTAFELGNGALYAPFPDRARALPREKSGRKKRSGCCKAIARICALRRRGRKGDIDCFTETREARERRETPAFTPSVTVSAFSRTP